MASIATVTWHGGRRRDEGFQLTARGARVVDADPQASPRIVGINRSLQGWIGQRRRRRPAYRMVFPAEHTPAL